MNQKRFRYVRNLLIFLLIILLSSFSVIESAFADKVSKDLRGRWDIKADSSLNESNLVMYVSDIKYDPNNGGFLATGCLETEYSKLLSPLSLQAEPTVGGGYEVSFLSTVLPVSGSPFVIKFNGSIQINGNSVADDSANGLFHYINSDNDDVNGYWDAKHHDRRRKECPPAEIPPFYFNPDVRAHYNYRDGKIDNSFIGFDGQTDIVSTGMIVETPDGNTFIASPYTDVFSPNIDFIQNFRFLNNYNSVGPVPNEPYLFSLLDALGNPIPGTNQVDVWTECILKSGPLNIRASIVKDGILLEWDAAVGLQSPGNVTGFYQIAIDPYPQGGNAQYGANIIYYFSHLIPFEYGPAHQPFPDGFDNGKSLNQLDDGEYMIWMSASSFPPDESGKGQECVTSESENIIIFCKNNDQITLGECQ